VGKVKYALKAKNKYIHSIFHAYKTCALIFLVYLYTD
jgi:hypothetical protein